MFQSVTNEDVTQEDLGGAKTHTTMSGKQEASHLISPLTNVFVTLYRVFMRGVESIVLHINLAKFSSDIQGCLTYS